MSFDVRDRVARYAWNKMLALHGAQERGTSDHVFCPACGHTQSSADLLLVPTTYRVDLLRKAAAAVAEGAAAGFAGLTYVAAERTVR